MNYSISGTLKIQHSGIITNEINKLFFRNPVFQASSNFHERKNYLICTNVKIHWISVFNVLYFFKELFWMEYPYKLILNKRFLK